MNQVSININKIKSNRYIDWMGYLLIILLVLLLLPLLIIYFISTYIKSFFIKDSDLIEPKNDWINLHSAYDLKIQYKWASVDDLPDFIYEYFFSDPLVIYKTEPKIKFFDGYFTKMRFEVTDGVYFRKVIADNDNQVIVGEPLYFFNYKTKEAEKIHDLKGYNIEFKEITDYYVIEGYNAQEEKTIELKINKS